MCSQKECFSLIYKFSYPPIQRTLPSHPTTGEPNFNVPKQNSENSKKIVLEIRKNYSVGLLADTTSRFLQVCHTPIKIRFPMFTLCS